MIKFLQSYTTKALPPESFDEGQEVERSTESELYFVRLGVAGFLIDGKLVDQDYQPIVRETVAVLVPVDRRFSETGRGGEVIGLDAPQRATSGPGNAVVFAGQPDNVGITDVEVEQLRADLATSIEQMGQHQTSAATQIESLTADLTLAQGAREAALSDVSTARSEREAALANLAMAQQERDDAIKGRDAALADLASAREAHDALAGENATLREGAETSAARLAELEQQLAAGTSSATETASRKAK